MDTPVLKKVLYRSGERYTNETRHYQLFLLSSVSKSEQKAHPLTLVLLPPAASCSLQDLTAAEEVCYCAEFKEDTFENRIQSPGTAIWEQPVLYQPDTSLSEYLYLLCEHVMKETDTEELSGEWLIPLLSPLLSLIRMHAVPLPIHKELSHPQKLVQEAQELVKQHYSANLTLQDVAEHLFVNASYLSRIFRSCTGKTFSRYLKEVRLDHVKQLLAESTLLITEVAGQTGFCSSSHLSAAFHSEYGISPKEYRDRTRNHTFTTHIQNESTI